MSELRDVLSQPYRVKKEETPASPYRFEGKKAFLVEDNLLNREIAQAILQDAGFTVDTADDGDVAVERLQDSKQGEFDLVLMDIQMPGRDGLSAAREILGGDGRTRVVFLTTFSDDEYIVGALRLGASGYLIKQDVAAIAPALREVMAGRRVLEGRAMEDVNFSSGDDMAARPSRPAAFACLTEREYEVAELIAQGLDNREIAAAAYMGEGTVRNHISSILAKLGLRNRTQIAIAYLRG